MRLDEAHVPGGDACPLQRARNHAFLSLDARRRIGEARRAAGFIEAAGPGLLHIGLASEEAARGAIQRVVEAIAIGKHDELARLAAHHRIHQAGRLGGIPVVLIVRRVLEVPSLLAGVGVERQHGI